MCLFVSVCSGREAGVSGCRFLHHSVQAFGQTAHGSRTQQLQALGGPQSVRHPSQSLHQHHAGVCVFEFLHTWIMFSIRWAGFSVFKKNNLNSAELHHILITPIKVCIILWWIINANICLFKVFWNHILCTDVVLEHLQST